MQESWHRSKPIEYSPGNVRQSPSFSLSTPPHKLSYTWFLPVKASEEEDKQQQPQMNFSNGLAKVVVRSPDFPVHCVPLHSHQTAADDFFSSVSLFLPSHFLPSGCNDPGTTNYLRLLRWRPTWPLIPGLAAN